MRAIINGSTGRMGKILADVIARTEGIELAAGCAIDGDPLEQCDVPADVVIDFSHHASTKLLCDYCTERNLPLVVCATGQTEAEKEMLKEASGKIPVFMSANMSLGVAVLIDLVEKAARMFPEADIEIVEKHHNQKLDVPSGTALMLARAVKNAREDAEFVIGRHENGKRTKQEVGIHSLRMGSETGTHEVYIRTDNECLVLTHQAFQRAVFADGAVKAAFFLVKQKPGMYDMKDLEN